MTPKTPARQIYTSIRVPCTKEEYEAICRAAAARGAHSKAAWLRERGASFGLADGMEALAVREEALDALRALLETREAYDSADRRYATAMEASAVDGARDDVFGACAALYSARDAYYAARARAREVAK